MAGKKIRLFKIASEINIGKEAIVEYLQSKGFDIQNKAISALSVEMQELVFDKFKKEKRAAEIQRDKIEKHHKARRVITGEVDELEPAASEEKEVEKTEILPEKEVEEIKITHDDNKKVEKATPKEPIKEIIKNETISKKTTKKKIEVEKDKATKKVEPVTEKAVTSEKKVTVTNKTVEEIKDIEIDKKLKTVEKEIKVNDKVEPEKKIVVKDEKKSIKPEVDVIDEKDIVKDKPPKAEKLDEKKKIDNRIVRKKRTSKKVAEVEIGNGKISQLPGLTIVGKIDLKKAKQAELAVLDGKKAFKKDADEEENQKQGKKKGRKSKERQERKKKRRISIREQISDNDIQKALKKTLSEISDGSSGSKRSKLRQKKKSEREEKEQKTIEEQVLESKILKLTEFVTTADLAELMDVNPNEIILKCMGLGLIVTLNQRLDKDTIILIADDYNFEVEFIDNKAAQFIDDEDDIDDEDNLVPRSPIVTVMGHVDHGKTSLLDFIRKTSVVAGEAGGITQHIGAYRVELENKKHITFLDTPGHEAFTAMRARGAKVTDIVILVVAADDSVMPQTIEAISHAQAANVPIVVAINKIDKPDANPERIKQQLSEQNILIEEWGGKYQSIELSAKTGKNIDVLLEKILLEAEMLELKANPDRQVRSTIVEANMDRGLGAVATVIVQKGTLRIGDSFVAGVCSGKVRAMFDERGKKVKEAGPSIPIRVIGFNQLPEAGDVLAGVASDSEARSIANERHQLKREQEFRQIHLLTLDDISQQIKIGGVKDLYLIIKGDVSGSVEALSDSLQKQSTEEVRVVVLHKGVGAITESDVMLAVASRAVIVGFQVSPTVKARNAAAKEKVDIRLYNIIYDAINEIRLALEGLLTPDIVENITAKIEIRKVYKISKLGYIAGCYILSGKVNRNDRVRVLRDDLVVYNGTLHSLKREKEDVKEVDTGYECGIMLEGFHDIEVDDIIEGYKLSEVKRTLSN